MASNPNQNWTPPPVPGQPALPTADSSSGGGWDMSWATWLIGGPHAAQQDVQDLQQIGSFLSNAWNTATYVSPETRLSQLIMEKMGVGPGATRDLKIAAQQREAEAAAHQAMIDPNYRRELVTSLGWNTNNPQVQKWIASGGTLPDNPTGTGAGTAAGTPPGQAGTTTQTGAIAAPFDYSKWTKGGGLSFGDLLPPWAAAASGETREEGNDYSIPTGTQLFSPFAGTVIEADYNDGYGNTVVVRLANGVTYRMSHLESLNVQKGATASPGMLVGLSGSTGNSSGPHVDIEMRDPQGNPIDPRPIIDPLLAPGADLSATGLPYQRLTDLNNMVANQPGPFLTPDGHWIYPGSQDYNVYAAAQSLWKKRYGGDPPWSFVSGLIAGGNTTAEQIQAAMDAMPSDIANMDWGTRDAFTNDVNSQATKAWDRPVPDSVVKTLAAQGITNAGQVQNWIASHPMSAIDPSTRAQIYDATNQQTQPLWQQPPSPDLIAHIHQQMQQGPTTGA